MIVDQQRVSAQPAAADAGPQRSRVAHDVVHELATIRLLATALHESSDLGPRSRRYTRALIEEVCWLRDLVGLLDVEPDRRPDDAIRGTRVVRLDQVVARAADSIRVGTTTRLEVANRPAEVLAAPLTIWRIVRNLLINAVSAAGPHGAVVVRTGRAAGQVTVVVENDLRMGSGRRRRPIGDRALDLRIVEELVASLGGSVAAGATDEDGWRVRVRLPDADATSNGRP